MTETIASPLSAWESFYVIVGSSAAALTGLQFVVIALIAESSLRRSTTREIDAFGTPQIVHFCAALLVAAILSAPWPGLASADLALGTCGLAGVVYVAIVTRRAVRQTGYQPVFEDWLWHSILPFLSYSAFVVSAIFLRRDPAPVLFAPAAASLLLVFIGIHNAWDTVTYIAITQAPKNDPGEG